MRVGPLSAIGQSFAWDCYCNQRWRSMYGLDAEFADLAELFQARFVTQYPWVQRYEVFDAQDLLVATVTVDYRSNDSPVCVMTGGIDPARIGSGTGIRSLVAIVRHVFNSRPQVDLITLVPQNPFSLRMVVRVGFLPSAGVPSNLHQSCQLARQHFPNSFCTRLLRSAPNGENPCPDHHLQG